MMDKNPYDTSIDWLAPQYQANKQGTTYIAPDQQVPTFSANYYQAQQSVPTQPPQKKAVPPKQARMSKQRALELVNSLKKGIVVSSVVSFGLLGLLATNHAVGTTTGSTNTSAPIITHNSSPSTTPSGSSTSNSPSSTNNSGSFTTPSGSSSSGSSSNSSSSTGQGGYSFGSSPSKSSVSGTSVS